MTYKESKFADRVAINAKGTRVLTYKEALEEGYTNAEQKYEQGYISRKSNPDNHVVQISARGRFFVSLANPTSTRYCIRQYLNAPTPNENKGVS